MELFKPTYAQVILPVPVGADFSYEVPDSLKNDIAVGKRVIVPFGKNKKYSGIVKAIHNNPPVSVKVKPIEEVLDEFPIITENNLKFWDWLSSYYLCHIGEVMITALPSALKLQSETKVIGNVNLNDIDTETITEKEFLILEALELQPELSLNEIQQILGQKTIFPVIHGLLRDGYVIIKEDVKSKYKPKTAAFIELNPAFADEKSLGELFDTLSKAPKQLEAIMAYYEICKGKFKKIRKKKLADRLSSSSGITGLVKKEILFETTEEISRLTQSSADFLAPKSLSEPQEIAYNQIKENFKENPIGLLHGVTSSGKTNIYTKLILETIEAGKQALYLLPEIALTSQIISRLKHFFGDKIGVYHSGFNDQQRVEIWQKVITGEFKVILGARSALFLPFQDLGLIVIDEEHDPSYKQYDPAPRYHARDASTYLAHLHGAKVLLGSATPAFETMFNALRGKYKLTTLEQRYGNLPLPSNEIVNLLEARNKRKITGSFSHRLLEGIKEKLDIGEQVILFQNRRGYVPVMLCNTCGNSLECKNCDVTLTYHKNFHTMKCHLCGYTQKPLIKCPSCKSDKMEMKGFGTEKIEEELTAIFPKHKIGRLDWDVTRTKGAHSRIIEAFEDGEIDILVGTQMVAKGLDFKNVTLIGILNADSMLRFPDFRAYERSYQMMAQVSGRAGRTKNSGHVIIQSYDPKNRVLQDVMNYDYKNLYMQEMAERSIFKYPPYTRIISISIKHKFRPTLEPCAKLLGIELRKHFGSRILGPEYPPTARVRNQYIQNILIKLERENINLSAAKELIVSTIDEVKFHSNYKSCRFVIDVDPA